MKSIFSLIVLCCLGNLLVAQTGNEHSILQLRAGAAAGSQAMYLTDPGRQGVVVYDPADKTSPDDSAMTFVTTGGMRFKRVVDDGLINVKWFGASGTGATDDWYPIEKAIRYILGNNSPARTLYFPPGTYSISRPLLIARPQGSSYGQCSINLAGPAPARNIAAGYANIVPTFNNTFALGIQNGKGIQIRDLVFSGRFNFPNNLNPVQVDTLAFKEWTDGSCRQNTLSPYAGVVIDPFSDASYYPSPEDMYPGLHGYCLHGMNRGGSTAVQLEGCSIKNFVVGFMITPSDQQNGELIDLIDCDISSCKVGYAMGQAQSKECHVVRLKSWGRLHTLFDNVDYGFRHGDGAGIPMVDGANIAGLMKQLCNIQAASFSGSFRHIYAEGLFRIGFAGGGATMSFQDCQFDFGSQEPGLPYPDFYVLGSSAVFRDCMLRLYPGVPGARLILSQTNNRYEGGTTNAPPITVNIDNNAVYPNPGFRDVNMYYSGGVLGSSNIGVVTAASPMMGTNVTGTDPVYPGNTFFYRNAFGRTSVSYRFTYGGSYERTVALSGEPVLHVDHARWTAWLRLSRAADVSVLRPGDFLLTSGLHFQDQFSGINAATYPVGIIRQIGHDTVYLQNIAYGIRDGMKQPLYMTYFVNEEAPFTGNLAAGSNTIEQVQGYFPAAGARPDIPMVPAGTYVVATDPTAKTIRLSNASASRRSFNDYTFINGNPKIELYSTYSIPQLQQLGKTLLGGALFYRYDDEDVNLRPTDYYIGGTPQAVYRILNTNFNGDTTLHKLSYVPLPAATPNIPDPHR